MQLCIYSFAKLYKTISDVQHNKQHHVQLQVSGESHLHPQTDNFTVEPQCNGRHDDSETSGFIDLLLSLAFALM